MRIFKAGDLCVAVVGKYTPSHKDKNGNHFQLDAIFRYCPKVVCVSNSTPNFTVPPKEIILTYAKFTCCFQINLGVYNCYLYTVR